MATRLAEPLLIVRRVLHEHSLASCTVRLLDIVRNDDVCRRLMTVPGALGPVVALTRIAPPVDVPARFKNSKAVGASFGLDAIPAPIRRERPPRRHIAVRETR